jgi:hypothetical protein
MRPCYYLIIVLLLSLAGDALLYSQLKQQRVVHEVEKQQVLQVVNSLGISDLAVSTEARYTRHPAASDPVVPFMDHPGALEHFPSGSYFHPSR